MDLLFWSSFLKVLVIGTVIQGEETIGPHCRFDCPFQEVPNSSVLVFAAPAFPYLLLCTEKLQLLSLWQGNRGTYLLLLLLLL